MFKDIITLDWKTFKVDLPSLEAYLRNKYTKYVGNQAKESGLDLYFSDTLTDTERTDIIAYYDSLTEAEETRKCNLGSRKPWDVKKAKLDEIKLGMIGKAKSAYTSIEQKIDLGLDLTDADWDTLL